ncbi:MAG TPA: glycoside hydrolase family 20 zincin-like fold domain-containing protein [Vicinamibacteria bacterium]|nr:glycoside hydrolase family 20 zincin-like fold domain-containing protein [Vicinamibacteria bacterium]
MRTPPLLPSPKKLVQGEGAFPLRPGAPIVLPEGAGESDFFTARAFQAAIRVRAGFSPPIETHARREDLGPRIELLRRGALGEGYRITVSREEVRAEGDGEPGLRYAVESLSQLLPQRGRNLAVCEIEDAPDLAKRGLLLDISRGKVPTLATLKGVVDFMVGLKLNLLMLYTEHVFRFRRHPLIGKDASPMSAWELRDLDEYARRRHVELVPTLQSLGHMHQILKYPRYRKLAESERRWSVSPALEETYELLDDLYSEYLGNFGSPWLNANCDEPVDLGKGLSKGRAETEGVAAIFASHVARVQELAAKHGKKTMIWADFIFEHPEVLPLLPKGLLLIDWWYEANHDFERVKTLRENGIPFMAAAGTSGWNTLFPRVDNALANIRGYAEAAKLHGAEGLLVTEWGDGGHGNLLGNSIYGFAFGAQAAWGPTDVDAKAFDRAFSMHLFSDPSEAAGRLYRRLGELHGTGFDHFNHSPLKTLLFDDVIDARFTSKAKRPVLERTLQHLRRVAKDFESEREKLRSRPDELEELRYALEASILAAEKGLAGIEFLCWRENPPEYGARAGKSLASELRRIERAQKRLKRELRRLWLARNRPDGFEKMRSQYDASVRGLRRAAREVGARSRRQWRRK